MDEQRECFLEIKPTPGDAVKLAEMTTGFRVLRKPS